MLTTRVQELLFDPVKSLQGKGLRKMLKRWGKVGGIVSCLVENQSLEKLLWLLVTAGAIKTCLPMVYFFDK